jgi:hypothetical protein
MVLAMEWHESGAWDDAGKATALLERDGAVSVRVKDQRPGRDRRRERIDVHR